MPVPVRYALTTVVIVIVTWARVSWGEGSFRYPFLLYLPIIFACGVLLDRGNGVYATILSTFLCNYFLILPRGSVAVASGEDELALGLFFAIGVAISLVVEALHVGLVELTEEHDRAHLALADRKLLLEELSHRTRNDFANVVTLLNLQARSANEEVRTALLAAADRVQTIARVHRRLELRDNRVVVDTRSYIGDLCSDLRVALLAMRPIAIECQAESHSLSLEKAIPLGLIVNESITNAAKHAFPDGRHGRIDVTFERRGNVYNLTISDNGVGPQSPVRDGALGNRLMRMLAGQLGSSLEIEPRDPGTAVVVTIAVRTAVHWQQS